MQADRGEAGAGVVDAGRGDATGAGLGRGRDFGLDAAAAAEIAGLLAELPAPPTPRIAALRLQALCDCLAHEPDAVGEHHTLVLLAAIALSALRAGDAQR